MSATGSEGGETSRTHVQVLANSIVASLLVLVDLFLFNPEGRCFGVSRRENVALVGIVAYVPLLPSFLSPYRISCLRMLTNEKGTTRPSRPIRYPQN